MTQRGGSTVTAIDRAMDVLTLFATTSRDHLGVTEIARELDLSKAVVHRILTTFAAKGYVRVGERSRYSLGPAVLELGFAYLDRVDVRESGREALEELCGATDETATLSVRDGWNRFYIDQVTPRREVHMAVQLGHPFPLHAGASSKSLLAYLPAVEREDYLENATLEALTSSTITDVDELRQELAMTRERGYASSAGERQTGAASVAAPIFDHTGLPVASISACGPRERFVDIQGEAAQQLLRIAADLSRRLGYVGGDGRGPELGQ